MSSRRNDHLMALQAALGQARDVGVTAAIEMMAKVMALPEECFPLIDAPSFKQFYNWLRHDGDAPEWVLAAVQTLPVSETAFVWIKYAGASVRWWKEARDVSNQADLPPVALPLFDGSRLVVKMTRDEWERLLAWVETIQGDWEHEEPFELYPEPLEPG